MVRKAREGKSPVTRRETLRASVQALRSRYQFSAPLDAYASGCEQQALSPNDLLCPPSIHSLGSSCIQPGQSPNTFHPTRRNASARVPPLLTEADSLLAPPTLGAAFRSTRGSGTASAVTPGASEAVGLSKTRQTSRISSWAVVSETPTEKPNILAPFTHREGTWSDSIMTSLD